MQILDSITPQYLTDADGNRTAVVLPLGTFRQIVAELATLNSEISESDWLKSASQSPAFADLADPAEDLYSSADGVPFQP